MAVIASLIGGPAYAAGATLLRNWKLIAIGTAFALLSLYAWRVDALRSRHLTERDQARTEYALFRTAIQAQVANEVARMKEKSREADIQHTTELADARAATAEYIRTHRVRLTAPIHSSAPAKAGNAAISETVSAHADVAISDADVRACTEAATYAMSAHNWAMNLGGE